MARTKTITDEQILQAARTMFDEHGYTVTTAQIADAAGISEGSIYRRWATKEELMIDALGIQPPPLLKNIEGLVSGELSLERQLEELGNGFLDFFLENLPKFSVMMACGLEMRRKMLKSNGALPAQGIRALIAFFEHHRRAGNLRTIDPEVTARMFVASLHHYAFAEIIGLNDVFAMPRETYLRGIVQNLLYGVAINE